MSIVSQFSQSQHVENSPECPEALARLRGDFHGYKVQKFLDESEAIGPLVLTSPMKALFSVLQRGMVHKESLLSPTQIRCYPSVKRLAVAMGCSSRTARRAIRQAEKHRLLNVTENISWSDGKNLNNQYNFTEVLFAYWGAAQLADKEDIKQAIEYVAALLARTIKAPPRLSVINGGKSLEAKLAAPKKAGTAESDLTPEVEYITPRRVEITPRKESAVLSFSQPMSPPGVTSCQGGGDTVSPYLFMLSSPYISNTKNTTLPSTGIEPKISAEMAEEELHTEGELSQEDQEINRLIERYSAITGQKVPRRQLLSFHTKLMEYGTSLREVEANICRLETDPLLRATTTTFARMGARPANVNWGLQDQSLKLKKTFEYGMPLSKNSSLRETFKTDIEAVRELFPDIYDNLRARLPGEASEEAKLAFLASLSNDEVRGCHHREIHMESLFASRMGEEVVVEASTVEVTPEVREIAEETVKVPEAQIEVEAPEPKQDQRAISDMRTQIVLHLVPMVKNDPKATEQMVAFCKSPEIIDAYIRNGFQKSKLDIDFARFLRQKKAA